MNVRTNRQTDELHEHHVCVHGACSGSPQLNPITMHAHIAMH